MRFVGEDGSMGYRTGQIYRLRIERPGRSWPVAVTGLEPHGPWCPYGSEDAYVRNWQPPHVRTDAPTRDVGECDDG